MKQKGRVTYAKADRVILAIAALTECSDFEELALEVGAPQAQAVLDLAADLARTIRDTRQPRAGRTPRNQDH